MPTPLDIVYLTAAGLASPWLVRRLRSGKGRIGFREKLTGRVLMPPKVKPRIWFHGVSVGEVHVLRTIVPAFRARRPDVEAVISSTTDTGIGEARKVFPDLHVVPWPYDFSWACRQALRQIQPDLIVLGESELWPGMLLAAERARVPVVVVNGRLSPKSARRWQRAGPLARVFFGRIACFGVQTEEYADNLRSIGVPNARIRVTGSVKYDGVETNRTNPQTARLRDLFGILAGETVWAAGSTQDIENKEVVAIWQRLPEPRPRLILVPRQPDRFDAVAAMLQQLGVPYVRRSMLPRDAFPASVVLVDTIGELRAVWGLADIAFVGGSLDGQRGGQNMIEPAGYGAAVTFGPHVWNFQATVEQLVSGGGAIMVPDAAGLEAAVRRLLDPQLRQSLGTAARKFVLSQQGATDRTLDLLDRFLPKPAQLIAA